MANKTVFYLLVTTLLLTIVIGFLTSLFSEDVVRFGFPWTFYTKQQVQATCLEAGDYISCPPETMKPRIEWQPLFFIFNFLFYLVVVLLGQGVLKLSLKKRKKKSWF